MYLCVVCVNFHSEPQWKDGLTKPSNVTENSAVRLTDEGKLWLLALLLIYDLRPICASGCS